MENKKSTKSFWIGVAFAILLVAAVVGGVFTYKYFTEKDNEPDLMTVAEAKTLVNKIYSDVGFEDDTASSSLVLQPNLLDLDSYTFQGFEPVNIPEGEVPLKNNMYWIQFLVARYFLNNYEVEEKKLYTMEGPVCDIGIYFESGENEFHYWFFPIMNGHDEYYRIQVSNTTSDDWAMTIIYKPNSNEVAGDVFKNQTGGMIIAHQDGKISKAIGYATTFDKVEDVFKKDVASKDKLTGFYFEKEDRINNKKTVVNASNEEITNEMFECVKELHPGWYEMVENGINLEQVLKQVPAKVEVKYSYFLDLYNTLIGE